ncbi:MAG: DUF5916 domain-containing protein, partial [Bacteroidota bacterium]|nr:DUF5916 domain-containing protein [Bacteroidota bacterium]
MLRCFYLSFLPTHFHDEPIFIAVLFFTLQTHGFNKSPSESKSVAAIRLNQPLKIDGKLTEGLYQSAGRTDFTQREPIEGTAPTQKTEFWIGYDDAALYIGANLFDTSPDSIVKKLGRRDSFVKSDWFLFSVDSYYDRRNAFFFGVNPAGSIVDGTFFNDSWDDDSWDGIWDRAVSIHNNGWSVEIKIPYSQLRFNKKQEHVWGLNVARTIARNNEEVFFVMVPRKESGFVSHYADLTGIKDIDPPARFEILPYVNTGGEFTENYTKGDPFNDGSKFTKNVGADFKIGIGNNLTLDATINPDFGQVEVDPAEVNLSQFETYYSEKRPFFIEGANIFSFGSGGATNNMSFNWMNPQFFYSRRIGRKPHRNDLPAFNNTPTATSILGAGKLSGKINDEQSIGLLAAVTEREFASISEGGHRYKLQVEPLTFYGLARTQFEFEQGRYGLGYLLTSVERDLYDIQLKDILNRRSYSVGTDGWVFLDDKKTWVTNGWVGFTYVSGSKERIMTLQKSPQRYFQRPDAKHLNLDSNATSLAGIGSRFTVNKEKNNWIFNSAFGFLSPSFEINDLGFQNRADVYNAHIATGYRWYEPDIFFRNKSILVATARNYDFDGIKTAEIYFLNINATFLNYWGFGSSFFYGGGSTDTRSTRGGPSMHAPAGYTINFNCRSDSREAISFFFFTSVNNNEAGSNSFYIEPSVEWKPLPSVNFSFSPNYNSNFSFSQYITRRTDEYTLATYGRRYIFGELNQKTLAANVRLNWTFTPTLSLQLYLQPLISVGKYSRIKELARAGSYDFNVYGENGSTIAIDENGHYVIDPDGVGSASTFTVSNPDFNFKSLRGNAVLRWEYLPGSTLFFVWTQSREDNTDPGSMKFGRDFSNLMDANADNIFMIKATYWFSL